MQGNFNRTNFNGASQNGMMGWSQPVMPVFSQNGMMGWNGPAVQCKQVSMENTTCKHCKRKGIVGSDLFRVTNKRLCTVCESVKGKIQRGTADKNDPDVIAYVASRPDLDINNLPKAPPKVAVPGPEDLVSMQHLVGHLMKRDTEIELWKMEADERTMSLIDSMNGVPDDVGTLFERSREIETKVDAGVEALTGEVNQLKSRLVALEEAAKFEIDRLKIEVNELNTRIKRIESGPVLTPDMVGEMVEKYLNSKSKNIDFRPVQIPMPVQSFVPAVPVQGRQTFNSVAPLMQPSGFGFQKFG